MDDREKKISSLKTRLFIFGILAVLLVPITIASFIVYAMGGFGENYNPVNLYYILAMTVAVVFITAGHVLALVREKQRASGKTQKTRTAKTTQKAATGGDAAAKRAEMEKYWLEHETEIKKALKLVFGKKISDRINSFGDLLACTLDYGKKICPNCGMELQATDEPVGYFTNKTLGPDLVYMVHKSQYSCPSCGHASPVIYYKRTAHRRGLGFSPKCPLWRGDNPQYSAPQQKFHFWAALRSDKKISVLNSAYGNDGLRELLDYAAGL